MALIEYPTTGWDTFCSLANAEALLLANVPSAQRTDWDALIDADKEIILRQATIMIRTRITLSTDLPLTLDPDLQLATAYVANSSIGVDMLTADKSSNIKVKEVACIINTEYFARGKDSNSFPDIAIPLLSKFNFVSDSSFSFSRSM